MGRLLGWAGLSALVVASIDGLIYAAVVVYAKGVVGPTAGSGSEAVAYFAGALSLSVALVVGLLALAMTFLYWLIHLSKYREVAAEDADSRSMKLSLVLVPLVLSAACMLVILIWFT